MLRGKGLTDWEWVYKTFPKWMLQEMDPQEPVNDRNGVNKNHQRRHNQAPQHTLADNYRVEVW
jgi:hypothetical protein